MKLLLSLATVALVIVAATAAPQQHKQKQVAPAAVADNLFRAEPTATDESSSSTEGSTEEGSTASLETEESTVSPETEGSTVSSETEGSTVSSETEGSTVSSETEGSTVSQATVTTANPGLSDGEIAGIVIGSLAGVALIAGGIFIMHKKGIACFAK